MEVTKNAIGRSSATTGALKERRLQRLTQILFEDFTTLCWLLGILGSVLFRGSHYDQDGRTHE